MKQAQSSSPGLIRRAERGPIPLSFAQQRLWFLDQLLPNISVYNQCQTVRVTGSLDLEALERAVNEMRRRHDVLRTNFHVLNDNPVQIVAPYEPVPLTLIDYRDLPEDRRDIAAQDVIKSYLNRPYNLKSDPLMRTCVLRLSDTEHLLVVALHHIISDGWSQRLIVEEVATLYEAFHKNRPSPLKELPVQYSDYSRWHREWLQGRVFEKQLQYWKKQLGGVLPVAELPMDYRRPNLQTFNGKAVSAVLSAELSQTLQSFSRQQRATVFMTILAVFQMFLHRLTRQEDILTGTPVAGRGISTTEGMIGLFVNMLALRGDLSGNPTFLELLQRARSLTLDALDHQDMPFEKLVEELQPQRNLSHTPFFQVMLNVFLFEKQPIEASGVRFEEVVGQPSRAQFDLIALVRKTGENFRVDFTYNADLFHTARVEEMLGQFVHLLEQIVDSPNKPLRSYSLITRRARAVLPDPTARMDEPEFPLVASDFLQRAREFPRHTSVTQSGRSWTYEELSAAAVKIAHALVESGVAKPDVVAITGPRSFGLVASMAGTFMSGGVMLTIDRHLPPNRQRLMLTEARARYLLYVGPWRTEDNWLRDVSGLNIIPVSELGAVATTTNDISLPNLSPDDPAYIFFTSGTTGIPKGVLCPQKGVSQVLAWQRTTFNIGPEDRCAQLTNLSFDIVLQDIFLPLVCGAAICLPDAIADTASDQILPWMDREGITLFHAVPTLSQSWLGLVSTTVTLSKLRYVFFVGEPLSEALVRDWRRVVRGPAAIVNEYGPTETCIVKTWHLVSEELLPGIQDIGAPLPQTQMLILNGEEQLCGIGEAGEIVIRTPFRAIGYINAPEEQKARFAANPFRNDPTDVVYRTGDLARYRPNGTLEFLGRIDDQVKIRGVRVEPAETAAILAKHPSVKNCFVTASQDPHGFKILVGYVVASVSNPTAAELRSYLSEHLPNAMVPSAFVFLDTLPVTGVGKIDRRALPPPDFSAAEEERVFVAPRTPVERQLAEVWCRILKVNRVSIQDDFFNLGGHSLLATQLVSHIRREFNVELPLRAIFEKPIFQDLASYVLERKTQDESDAMEQLVAEVESLSEGSAETELRDLERQNEIPRTTGRGAPLSFAQLRLWFLHRFQPDSSAYNIIHVLRFTGPLEVEALERALNEIRRRHEILRANFQLSEEQPVQVIAPFQPLLLPIVDLSGVREQDRAAAWQGEISARSSCPFNLESDSLMRCSLLRLGPDQHLLCVILHHIVSDGWSQRVMAEEIAALYDAFVHKRPSPLPEVPIQYTEYARWQRDWFQGPVLEEQLAYWKTHLKGNLPVLDLPGDRPRTSSRSHQGNWIRELLRPRLIDALESLGKNCGATLFMIMMAVFQTLLHRLSGQEDFVVGIPVAGRNRWETQKAIGCFLNTLALRAQVSDDPPFDVLLQRVRSTFMAALDHQDLPFEKLVEALQPDRNLSYTPLFQVMLNVFILPEPEMRIPDLTIEHVPWQGAGSKCDLTLYVQKRSDGFYLDLSYDSDLFDPPRMQEFTNQFIHLLEQIVACPDKPIRSYLLVTPNSRRLLPDPTVELAEPQFAAVTEEFLSCVKRAPLDIALSQGTRCWTYQELSNAAAAVAKKLSNCGFKRGSVVAITGDRSFGLIAGVVGILMGGGVLLPIDRNLPKNRRLLMMTQAAATYAVHVGAWRDDDAWLLETADVQVIELANEDDISRTPEIASPALNSPDSAAYIFFTSGTTGTPKGVLGRHKGLSHFLAWQRSAFHIGPGDRCAQLTNPSFDVFLRDIFLPLTSGGTLCLPDDGIDSASESILSWMDRERITSFHAVPALVQTWLDARNEGVTLRTLRWAFLAGEALTEGLVRRWRQALPEAGTLVNLYGPTETTLVKSFNVIAGEPSPGLQFLGRALPNTQVLIMNIDGQLCGVGEPGEITIRTPFRTAGYINAPEEQQARFVQNPFRNDPQDLVYRTGDRGRYRADGTLEFLGRLDDQVKIRGLRIEPAEVNAVLARMPGVNACFVKAWENPGQDTSLAAYIVPADPNTASANDLRRHLSEQLPAAMVPSSFVFLDALPLTPNGKVDRRALPTPGLPSVALRSYEPPRTPMEQSLAKMWRRVLKLERVGIQDNFFDLGGHSLAASQLAWHIQREFGIEMQLRTIFLKPTIESLSLHLLGCKASVADPDELNALLTEMESLPEEDGGGQ